MPTANQRAIAALRRALRRYEELHARVAKLTDDVRSARLAIADDLAIVHMFTNGPPTPIPANDPLLVFDELVRLNVVSNRTTLYRRIKAGEFPPPVKIGWRSVAWRSSEVTAWIAQRIAERDKANGNGKTDSRRRAPRR